MTPTLVGSFGVMVLLVAYGLNLIGKLAQSDRLYLAMNFAGSMMAAWYAWAGNNVPFVILEGVWALVSVVQMMNGKRKGLRV